MSHFRTLLKKRIILVLILLTAGIAVHFSVLQNPFKTADDQFSILDNPSIKSFSHLKDIFTASFFEGKSYYRPLVSLSFMMNYYWGQENPFVYNLTNVLLHVFCGILVFLLLEEILLPRRLSFLAALLFLIHPVQWEAVSNISGRAILLSAFFALAAFYSFVRSLKSRVPWLFYFFSLACFLLSLLSKESGAMVPGVIFLYLFFFRDRGRFKKKIFSPVIPFILILTGYLLWRKSIGVVEIFPWPSLKMEVLGVLTFLRGVLTFLRLFIFPVDLHFDRSLEVFQSFVSPGMWVTIMVYAVTVYVLVKLRKRISLKIWFLIAWFCVELFPVSQIVGTIGVRPGFISTAEHFLYLPSVSAFALLIMLGRWISQKNEAKKIISPGLLKTFFVIFYIAMVLITLEQETYSSRETSMLKRTLKYQPQNTRIRSSLALGLAEKGYYRQAEEQFRQVLESYPENTRARIGLGKTLCDEGRTVEGMREYEKITHPGKYKELLEKNLKLSYNGMVQKYEKKLKEEGPSAVLYYSLGVMEAKLGDLPTAMEYYENALKMNPRLAEALFNLAFGYDALGQEPKALDAYQRFLDLNGDTTPLLRKKVQKRIKEIRNKN